MMPQPEPAIALDFATPTFLLIDPLLGEPLPALRYAANTPLADIRSAREDAWGREILPIELDPIIPLGPALHPYLVVMQDHDDPWLEFSKELAESERQRARADGLTGEGIARHTIGGWLQTFHEASDLPVALAKLMRLRTRMHTNLTYLRLADRRVLDWLARSLAPERLSHALPIPLRWFYPDVQGKLAKLEFSPAAEQQQPEEKASRLILTRDEFQRVMQGEAIHRTVARWQGAKPAPDQPADQLYALAWDAWQRVDQAAKRWPAWFTTLDDRVAWAVLSLLHPNLIGHTGIHRCLSQLPTESELETLHTICGTLLALIEEGELA